MTQGLQVEYTDVQYQLKCKKSKNCLKNASYLHAYHAIAQDEIFKYKLVSSFNSRFSGLCLTSVTFTDNAV